MTEWYFNPVGGIGLTAIAALGLLLLLTLAGLPRFRLTPQRRSVLLALRLAVIALTIIALLRPSLVYSTFKKQSSTLVLLLDRSRSMTVADAVGGKTRWEQLCSALDDALASLRSLREDLEIKAYTFDSDVHEVDFSRGTLNLPTTADGQQSAIGAALDDVLRREAGKRLAGVILLSDGAQRAYAPHDLAPQGPTRRLADLGFPLYVLPLGQARGASQTRDVAVKELSVNQTVYVKNRLNVHGDARIDGFAGHNVSVQLLFEDPAGVMEPVARTQIISREDGQAVSIDIYTVPENAGEYKLTLKADTQPGELVTTNNQISTFVTVLKGGINVLYIEGAIRQEQLFVRNALDASADIKVDYIGFNQADSHVRPPDISSRLAAGKYDVFIIGDVDSSFFSKENQAALVRAVQAGAGLVMIGGLHTFGPGGYADTMLADLLPITMDVRERQRLNDPPRSDVQLPGPVRMRPAKPLGERHYLMALAGAGPERSLWEQLPPLDGANRFGGVKQTAQVLGESSDGKPLLVVHDRGGRVVAFAADSTWLWTMAGYGRQHRQFWRQVILWAAHKDESSETQVWIKLAQRRHAPLGRVEFAAGMKSPEGDALAGVRFEAEVTMPDGSTKKVSLVRDGDQVNGVFDETQQAGDYALRVTADNQGATGTARSRFLVFEQDLELDNAAADATLLANLAAMTKDIGGMSLAPEELPELLRRIRQQPREQIVESLVKRTPWDTWPFFLAFVALISSEWYLRKKWGLAQRAMAVDGMTTFPASDDGPIVRRGVVGAVVHNGHWLVIRRSATVLAPGAICFPGGGIECAESEEQALVREFGEELNVVVRPVRRLWRSVTARRVELFWWQAELAADARIEPNPDEVADVFWLQVESIVSHADLLDSNRAFFQALAAGEFAFE